MWVTVLQDIHFEGGVIKVGEKVRICRSLVIDLVSTDKGASFQQTRSIISFDYFGNSLMIICLEDEDEVMTTKDGIKLFKPYRHDYPR